MVHESGDTSPASLLDVCRLWADPLLDSDFGERGLALELLLSDTGKSLRLYIIEVGERSTFRRMQKTRPPRVDAAEIEALHGMHLLSAAAGCAAALRELRAVPAAS